MSERDTPNESDAPLVGTQAGDAAAPMRLRAEPPRVTRLSRKVLGGISLVAALGVGGALIYALQTRSIGPGSEELYSTQNRRTADGLAGLPRDYTGPVLGPPLPGDLGRPILDAQNRGQPVTPPMAAAPTVDPVEQRRRAEEEAARTSRVFFQTEARVAAPIATVGGPGSPSLSGLGLPGQPGAATAQDRQLAFLNAGVDRRTVSPDRVMGPASPYVLQTGAVIAAALITGIRSDLPGQITAQVTEHVYDSPTGRILLVPQGTRLIGEYSNDVGFGQRRVLCSSGSGSSSRMAVRSSWNVNPEPTRKAMRAFRMASTITGGISPRLPACRHCCRSAPNSPLTIRIGCSGRSATAGRTPSTTQASRSSVGNSMSRRP